MSVSISYDISQRIIPRFADKPVATPSLVGIFHAGGTLSHDPSGGSASLFFNFGATSSDLYGGRGLFKVKYISLLNSIGVDTNFWIATCEPTSGPSGVSSYVDYTVNLGNIASIYRETNMPPDFYFRLTKLPGLSTFTSLYFIMTNTNGVTTTGWVGGEIYDERMI